MYCLELIIALYIFNFNHHPLCNCLHPHRQLLEGDITLIDFQKDIAILRMHIAKLLPDHNPPLLPDALLIL